MNGSGTPERTGKPVTVEPPVEFLKDIVPAASKTTARTLPGRSVAAGVWLVAAIPNVVISAIRCVFRLSAMSFS